MTLKHPFCSINCLLIESSPNRRAFLTRCNRENRRTANFTGTLDKPNGKGQIAKCFLPFPLESHRNSPIRTPAGALSWHSTSQFRCALSKLGILISFPFHSRKTFSSGLYLFSMKVWIGSYLISGSLLNLWSSVRLISCFSPQAHKVRAQLR